jgi:hypothetical protein
MGGRMFGQEKRHQVRIMHMMKYVCTLARASENAEGRELASGVRCSWRGESRERREEGSYRVRLMSFLSCHDEKSLLLTQLYDTLSCVITGSRA